MEAPIQTSIFLEWMRTSQHMMNDGYIAYSGLSVSTYWTDLPISPAPLPCSLREVRGATLSLYSWISCLPSCTTAPGRERATVYCIGHQVLTNS